MKDVSGFEDDLKLRVCFFGTYRAEYTRNQVMIARLRSAGIQVSECHEQLWRDEQDRVQAASGGWQNIAFLWRALRVYMCLLRKYNKAGAYDVMLVGYPGHFDIPLARLLTWLRGKPLVWDILMSLYLIASERRLDQKSRLTVRGLRWIEKIACRLPELLIMDTQVYRDWFSQNYAISHSKFRFIPLGADDRFFQPAQAERSEKDDILVIYYGTFIPNHGVPYIVEAARILRDHPNIHFEFIGAGPDRDEIRAQVQQYNLSNITFVDWLEKQELVKRLAQADIILGTFGKTPQSVMTVHNKIFEGLAMAKPVITGDSPAVQEILAHGEQIYLVERLNPQALADAILQLSEDEGLRQKLSLNGYKLFIEKFTNEQLGLRLKGYLDELISK
jgi:glycosyltransferase involved in cell wall biosynthesis